MPAESTGQQDLRAHLRVFWRWKFLFLAIVVAVPVANVPGYLAQQRGFSDGTDLNRLMPG